MFASPRTYQASMTSKEILFNFQQQRFEVFKTQNPEALDFDVVFEINGKKLYANKFTLFSISSTFRSMLSERWTKANELIKIEGYSYDDFKELLTFIYSGECKLTNENISQMVDAAEFYDIQVLKDVCQKFLLKTALSHENVYQMRELSNKYSLKDLQKSVETYFTSNFVTFFKSEHAKTLTKSNIKSLIEEYQDKVIQENLFEGLCKWAENRAIEKQKLDESLNLNESIKEELSEFLPLIKFEKMNSIFLIKFVAKQSFLFTGNQLSDILWNGKKTFVKIIDKNGKIMKGEIKCDNIEAVATDIHSVKDQSCTSLYADYMFWRPQGSRPSTPSKLVKNEKIQWYLLFDSTDNIAIRPQSRIYYKDYLIAELFAEDGFELNVHCKIEVYSSG